MGLYAILMTVFAIKFLPFNIFHLLYWDLDMPTYKVKLLIRWNLFEAFLAVCFF